MKAEKRENSLKRSEDKHGNTSFYKWERTEDLEGAERMRGEWDKNTN